MYHLPEDIDNRPTLNWKKLWQGIFLKVTRALNSIDRHSLKKESVDRLSVGPNVIINANGVRLENNEVWYAQHMGGVSTNEPNVWNLHVTNIRPVEPESGGLIQIIPNVVSNIAISYCLEFLQNSDDLKTTMMWAARASLDGVRYSDGDAMNNFRFGSVDNGELLTLSGTVCAQVLPGEHIFNLDVHFPARSELVTAEINTSRFNW